MVLPDSFFFCKLRQWKILVKRIASAKNKYHYKTVHPWFCRHESMLQTVRQGRGGERKHWSVACDKRGLLRKIFLCPEGFGFDLTIKRSRAPVPPPPPPSHTHDPLLVPQLVRMWLQANHATFIGNIVAPGLNKWGQTTIFSKVWIFSLIILCAFKELF